MDTRNTLSALYPTSNFAKNLGAIGGRVVVRTQTGNIPVSGINVVARRIDRGVYPPVVGTQAFTAPPILDASGVPRPPQPQAATDPLATASSAVSGQIVGEGRYRIQGLPPGLYLVEIQQINFTDVQLPLPVEEFYSGPRESGGAEDQPTDFERIPVTAGEVTRGIDIVLNGFSDVGVIPIAEAEPNHIAPQPITIPASVTGGATAIGPSQLEIDLGVGLGGKDKIEDLYSFTLASPTRVYVLLESLSGTPSGSLRHLDLYHFTSAVNRRRSSLTDPNLLNAGVTLGPTEGFASVLQPGTYLVGVSAFAGRARYHLHVFADKELVARK
jgi:hypothetical protein